jgi:cadmium resistance protein CadD (predicted permease)
MITVLLMAWMVAMKAMAAKTMTAYLTYVILAKLYINLGFYIMRASHLRP